MVKLKVLLLLLVSHAVLSTNNGTGKAVTETQESNDGKNIKELPALRNKNLTKQVLSVKLHLSKNVTAKIKLNKLSKSKDSIELAKERFRKTTKTISQTYSKCKHIKCTAEEKPVCAKIVYKNNKTNVIKKPLYIIMINICEIKYAECHKGMEASVVPMKNCHPKLRKSLLATGKSRSKREVKYVDEVEYQANCPRVCPTRDVMVCAICQHRIYKTFPSICHMRMFQCYHQDEALELVSRYPCVMSAPFLSENPPMDPKGRVSEPGDTDLVMRFIRCREKGKLGNGPKCTFEHTDKFNDEVPETNENTDEY